MPKLHQVFVGCPFDPAIRRNYDKLKKELEDETPLHVVLADTAAISSTDYLLEHITDLIRDSACCIFDVTGGNANVSLEVGIAHALPAQSLLTLRTRKPRAQKEAEGTLQRAGEVKAIISDLQGRNRIEYKTYPTLKDEVLSRYLNKLPYMKRWTDYQSGHSSHVKHALSVFQTLRESGRTLRPRVIAMLDGTGIHADDLLKGLASAKLLTVRRGGGGAGGIYYPAK